MEEACRAATGREGSGAREGRGGRGLQSCQKKAKWDEDEEGGYVPTGRDEGRPGHQGQPGRPCKARRREKETRGGGKGRTDTQGRAA